MPFSIFTGPSVIPRPAAPERDGLDAESLARQLYRTLAPHQQTAICFDWDHREQRRSLLRTFVANHWQPTRPAIASAFYSATQQAMIAEIFRRLIDRDWHARILRQIADDTHGHEWGRDQSIAFFGDPETGPWQFVLAGRHITLRAGSDEDAAFGGPIFYGHAAGGLKEKPHHPGNVFWTQALAAGVLFRALDKSQQDQAVVDSLPLPRDIGFGGSMRGASVSDFDPAQKAAFTNLLAALVAPYRQTDRQRVTQCLAAQGGVAKLRIAFARANRISAPDWDDWRIEGPAFVWHFRGWPHVHGWVHIANAPGGEVNAHAGQFLFTGQDRLR